MIVKIEDKKYYQSYQTGSFYSIEENELIQHAMNVDGTLSEETKGSIDWDFVATEAGDYEWAGEGVTLYQYLKGIENALLN